MKVDVRGRAETANVLFERESRGTDVVLQVGWIQEGTNGPRNHFEVAFRVHSMRAALASLLEAMPLHEVVAALTVKDAKAVRTPREHAEKLRAVADFLEVEELVGGQQRA